MSKRVRDAQERGYPSKAYNPAACLYPLLALTDEEKEKYLDYKRVEGLAVRGCGISKGRLREFWKNLYKPSVRMKKQEEKKAVIEKIEALRKYIRFSPREIEVLSLYLEGKGDAEILKKLNISENALMQYRSFIAGKVKPFVRLPQGARVNKMPAIIEFVKNYDGGELVRWSGSSALDNPVEKPELITFAGDIQDAVRRARKKFIDEYNEKLRTLGRAAYEENQLGVNLCKEQVKEADAKMKVLESVEKELLKKEGLKACS